MNTQELTAILESHAKWLRGEAGTRANLARANLARADLADANLAGANLRHADLADANLADAMENGIFRPAKEDRPADFRLDFEPKKSVHAK